MSISYGFYNSVNHDRVYDALDMSRIFDGIINDGVFMNIGTALAVTKGEGMSVNVGIGRAWFDHTWTFNDAILPLEIDEAELALTRIDAVVLEVDSSDAVRANTIKVITGPVGATPSKPALVNTATVHQHALAYITIDPGDTEIKQANIENAIGTSETPFITGILETIDAEALLLQWDSQFREWNEQSKEEFDEWFENLQNILDSDAAGHLQNQIDDINDSVDEINSNLTDNDSLETTSKNTWGAINELLSYLTWKDCTVANKVVTLPQDYREISILVFSGFNNIHVNYSLSKKVVDALPLNTRLFIGYGGYGVTYASLTKGDGTLTLQESYIDGTNRISTATINAYYR